MKTYLHSGNAGDIIYILPTIAAQGPGKLYLNPDRPAQYATGLHHPGGGVMLNAKMCEMLKPLVEHCGIECAIWNGEEVDYNLDLFREERINLSAYDIRRWIMAVYPELRPGRLFMNRLIPVEKEKSEPYITVNLSSRYRNNAAGGGNKWKMLSGMKVHFIGVQEEYQAFLEYCPDAIHYQCEDFLEMAKHIAGGVFHFGNQSSPFAVAEIFDLPRALELSPYCPNVVSEGSNWRPIFNNSNMAYCVSRLQRIYPNFVTHGGDQESA